MRLAIIGLPNSSKTTIFNALTGQNRPTGAVTGGKMEVFSAVVNVPDKRVDWLSGLYKPQKTTYTTVMYSDVAGLDKGFGEAGLSGQLKNELAQVDGFIHVVRAFEDDTVPHPYNSIDAKRDVGIINSEFLLSDLISVEKRLERLQDDLKKGKKVNKAEVEKEIELINRLRAALEEEKLLREIALSDEEEKHLRGFGLYTQKPVLIILNTGDDLKPAADIMDYPHQNSRIISLQGKLEAEIAQLGEEDAAMFMEEYGITEPGRAKVIRMTHELMNLLSFFTVGEDEVRAWSVHVGATAREAAGVIHTDLAKGFIRAEVTPYEVLKELGDMTAVKAAGKMRLEGRDYLVKDGEIMHVKFNI